MYAADICSSIRRADILKGRVNTSAYYRSIIVCNIYGPVAVYYCSIRRILVAISSVGTGSLIFTGVFWLM